MSQNRIAVGSKNPVKLAAAEYGFRLVYPDQEFFMSGFSVASGVSDQPMGLVETRAGASNRANSLREQQPDFDFWVGIEGGIETIEDDWFASAWITVIDLDGNLGESKSGMFPLPPAVKKLVETGLELGHANDQVFGEMNSKHAGGAVGSLTNGLVSRQALYEHAMLLALIPFVTPELFR